VREAGIDPHDPCREAPAATAPLSAPRGAARNVPSPPSRIEHSGALQKSPPSALVSLRRLPRRRAPPRARGECRTRAWSVLDTVSGGAGAQKL
jgi:hypothetical protein